MWQTWCTFLPSIDTPASVAVPSSAGSTPFSTLNNVVLPAPFGPMMPRISPSAMVKLTLLTARRPPNDFDRPSTLISVVPDDASPTAALGAGRRRGQRRGRFRFEEPVAQRSRTGRQARRG